VQAKSIRVVDVLLFMRGSMEEGERREAQARRRPMRRKIKKESLEVASGRSIMKD
jgi:hypothetical protein